MEDVVINADKKEAKQKFVVRSAADLQRLKLEKLMKNPVSILRFSIWWPL